MDTQRRALLKLAAGAVLVAGGPAWAQDAGSAQIPTPFVENGQPVTLELVYRKPAGPGPFPTLLFTHGSVGNGNDPREVRFTSTYPELSAFLNARGWMVAILMRRGRGQSGGSYAEGWDSARARYACSLEVADSGLQRALADMEAARDHLARDPLVDPARLLVGGQSRGGMLGLMHAARHPDVYRGAVNFVGGWAGRACELKDEINARALAQAARFTQPTLWLYGERDPFYPSGYPEVMLKQFTDAGGKAALHVVTHGPLRNDHQIVRSPQLWDRHLAGYLEQIDRRK